MSEGVRKNGFQSPIDWVPVTAWTAQSVSVMVFIGTAASSLYGMQNELTWTFALYIPIVVVTAGLWVYCQAVDPALPGGIGMACMRESQQVTRYCSQCKKAVPGLDHHCVWLNTCIGRKNYFQFYLLSVFGWVFSLLQLVLGIYFLADEAIRESSKERMGTAMFILPAFNFTLSLSLFGSYFSLWMFHTYLLFVGQGTYLYMIEARKKQMEKRKQSTSPPQPTSTV